MILFTVGFLVGAAAVTILAVVVLAKLSDRFDEVDAHLRARSDLLDEAIAEVKRKDHENARLRADLRQFEAVREVTRALNNR